MGTSDEGRNASEALPFRSVPGVSRAVATLSLV